MTWYGANKDTLFVAVARESTDPRKFEATFENNGASYLRLATVATVEGQGAVGYVNE